MSEPSRLLQKEDELLRREKEGVEGLRKSTCLRKRDAHLAIAVLSRVIVLVSIRGKKDLPVRKGTERSKGIPQKHSKAIG